MSPAYVPSFTVQAGLQPRCHTLPSAGGAAAEVLQRLRPAKLLQRLPTCMASGWLLAGCRCPLAHLLSGIWQRLACWGTRLLQDLPEGAAY